MLHKNQFLTVPISFPYHSLTKTNKQTNTKPFNTKVVMIPVFLLQGLEYWEEIK